MPITATIFDIESTGFDELAVPTEIGWVLAEYERELDGYVFHPIEMHSFLIRNISYGEASPSKQDAEEITGITDFHTATYGIDLNECLAFLQNSAERSDFVCGHNVIQFDVPFLRRQLKDLFKEKKIVDTMIDIMCPKHVRKSLDSLTTHYRILNLFPHRALSDAISTAFILEHQPIDKLLQIVETPIVRLRANVTFDNRDLAKKHGFIWDEDHKIWYKFIRQYFVKEEIENCFHGGFRVTEI